jgi:hypothetical protein
MDKTALRRARWRAALIHLGCSAVLASAAAALVFLVWYPWPYSVLAGGIGLFILITGVDVVMGPLITLVVFDRRKPWTELRRDLLIVVLLQLSALGYGLHVLFVARPVALALETDRLRVVRAGDVAEAELPLAPATLQRLSLTGPVLLRTERPTDPAEVLETVERAMAGFDLGMRPKYWRAWDDLARRELIAAAKPLEPLQARYPARLAEFNAAIARTGLNAAQLRYLPMLSQHDDWIALVDVRNGNLVGYAPFNAY